MSGIDSRIVVIGLPTVAAALHADAEQAIWFTQAYTIGTTVALLFIGRVSDIVGRVKVYNLGFAIFTVGSLLTSVSPSPDFFIASRIFQGLGASALFANSAAIITDAFPGGELGKALGINTIAFRAGSIFGLTLSGLILSLFDWRYLFYVNIPVGVFGTAWAHVRLRNEPRLERSSPMDWPGFASFTVFISLLLLTLTFAAYGIAETPFVVLLGATSAISLALFIYLERRHPHPLLDLRLLRIREFTGGVVTQLINAMAFGAFILLMSLYLQLVKGLSPLAAGLSIVPLDVSLVLFGPISGKLSDRYGTRPFVTAGLLIVSFSLYLCSTIGPDTSYVTLVAFLVIAGGGMGLFVSPNMSSIMGSVPAQRRGVASGLRSTFFNVGNTLSFNIVILVLTFYLPYSLVSTIISSAGSSAGTLTDRVLFTSAIDGLYLVLMVVNLLSIIPSLLRGPRLEPPTSTSNSNTGAGAEPSMN